MGELIEVGGKDQSWNEVSGVQNKGGHKDEWNVSQNIRTTTQLVLMYISIGTHTVSYQGARTTL